MERHQEAADRLARACAGDARAFAELLGPLIDSAFRLAMTMLKERSAAEDAVQEASLKTWRKLSRVREGAAPALASPEPLVPPRPADRGGSARAWLFHRGPAAANSPRPRGAAPRACDRSDSMTFD